MDIQPATLTQVQRGRLGRTLFIDDDVGGIAQQLLEIDSSLRLAFSEAGGHFVVKRRTERPDGSYSEQLVTTAQQLDHRLLDRVRLVCSDHYDTAADMDRVDAQAERDRDHRFHEQVGPIAERLAHAIRKDLGVKTRAFIGSPDG